MNTSDTYKQYAADCMRLAENELSPEAKNVMLNMALAWLRLAQQKQAMAATAGRPAPALPGSAGDAPPVVPPRPH